MPYMVSWILKLTIEIGGGGGGVNIYEQIYGSNFSDEQISSGENISF